MTVRITLSFFAMWNYNRLNKQKEALCAAEGITADREHEFRDIGDKSPLFRLVIRYSLHLPVVYLSDLFFSYTI